MVARRSSRRLVVGLAVVVALGVAGAAAVAILRSPTRSGADNPPVANYNPTRDEKRCGKALLNDIYRDRKLGRVVYGRGCFEAALGTIPATGVLVYSTVKADIVTAYDRQIWR